MLLLDAGAFIAVERLDRDVIAMIKRERLAGRAPVTHGGIVGQIWRGGSGRQAAVARLLAGTEIVPLDADLGRRVGMLLARTKTSDVVDAALAVLAKDGDEILTADARDFRSLLTATGAHVEIVEV